MNAIVTIFQLPIMLLNLFGFIGSLIWLLVIGQWGSVLAGILTIIVAPFLLGLAVMPGLLFGAPAVWAARRGITVGVYFFGFLSAAYTYALISAWCGGVTLYFMKEVTGGAFWPMLIWTYGLATSPWTYMAQKDQSIVAFLAAFFAQVAYIVMMVTVALGSDLHGGMQAFAVVMIIGVFFHMRFLVEMQRADRLSGETVL